MKRLLMLVALMVLFASGMNAQVIQRATVTWITVNPGADPYLCVFGNTPEDVQLIDTLLNLGGKELRNVPQREEINLAQNIRREAELLNTRYVSVHIIQRDPNKFDEFMKGNYYLMYYFIVNVYERVNNRYYLVANNSQ